MAMQYLPAPHDKVNLCFAHVCKQSLTRHKTCPLSESEHEVPFWRAMPQLGCCHRLCHSTMGLWGV